MKQDIKNIFYKVYVQTTIIGGGIQTYVAIKQKQCCVLYNLRQLTFAIINVQKSILHIDKNGRTQLIPHKPSQTEEASRTRTSQVIISCHVIGQEKGLLVG